MFKSNTCNHFTVCKQMINIEWNYLGLIEILETIYLCAKKLSWVSLKMLSTKCTNCILIYMCKEDLALNNLQWLICHKTKPNHIYLIYMYKEDLALNNLQWLICHKNQLTYQPPSFPMVLQSSILAMILWGFPLPAYNDVTVQHANHCAMGMPYNYWI